VGRVPRAGDRHQAGFRRRHGQPGAAGLDLDLHPPDGRLVQGLPYPSEPVCRRGVVAHLQIRFSFKLVGRIAGWGRRLGLAGTGAPAGQKDQGGQDPGTKKGGPGAHDSKYKYLITKV
jgi:hypothetical protein